MEQFSVFCDWLYCCYYKCGSKMAVVITIVVLLVLVVAICAACTAIEVWNDDDE